MKLTKNTKILLGLGLVALSGFWAYSACMSGKSYSNFSSNCPRCNCNCKNCKCNS